MFWQTKWGGWLLSGVVVGMCAGIFLANHHKTVQILVLFTGFLLLNNILSSDLSFRSRPIVNRFARNDNKTKRSDAKAATKKAMQF